MLAQLPRQKVRASAATDGAPPAGAVAATDAVTSGAPSRFGGDAMVFVDRGWPEPSSAGASRAARLFTAGVVVYSLIWR